MTRGRFAPSPSGDLHLGNLRTLLLAWLFARAEGGDFGWRIEDLDAGRSREGVAERQLADAALLGLAIDPPVVHQSERRAEHLAAIATLPTYPCFCSRREIAEATRAPHGTAALPYPGTCRGLDDGERRAATERAAARGRRPALRVAAEGVQVVGTDLLHGPVVGVVDDFVVQRGDGAPSYQVAVVVDDAAAKVDQVVRGDDLLESMPRQLWLADRLGLPRPRHAHVPLVLGPDGVRLAKRDGPVTTAQLLARGWSGPRLLGLLASTLGWCPPGAPVTADELLAGFNPHRIDLTPTRLAPAALDDGGAGRASDRPV